MKNLLFISAAIMASACSAPWQMAQFPSSNVDAGYHTVKASASQTTPKIAEKPLLLTASSTSQPMALPAEEVRKQVKEAYGKLSKQEKKEVRQLLKKELKILAKANKKMESPHAVASKGGIDHDLKLAAIFGAVGIVGLIIGGNVFFVIGAIALIIGAVFFVMWLLRQ